MAVICGYQHTLVLDSEQTLWAFGQNESGQLGVGDTHDKKHPFHITKLSSIDSFSAGQSHSIVLDSSGAIWGCGDNIKGQLGLGPQHHCANKLIRIPVMNDIRLVACGHSHTIVVGRNGRIWGFGKNSSGELGVGDCRIRVFPTQIDIGIQLKDGPLFVKAVSCGNQHSLILDENGTVWAFGSNEVGQLGVGEPFSPRVYPTVIESLSNICHIAAGGSHSLVLDDEGGVWAFGFNRDGQLGLGNIENQYLPQKIPKLNGRSASCGNCVSMVIDNEGFLWGFGDNTSGQLGTGDQVPTHINPCKNPYLKQVEWVSCGTSRTIVIDQDGRLWSFGLNDCGQLGLGDRTNRDVPTEINCTFEVYRQPPKRRIASASSHTRSFLMKRKFVPEFDVLQSLPAKKLQLEQNGPSLLCTTSN